MFSRELYQKYDRFSKELLLKILQKYGFQLVGDLSTEYYKETDIIVYDPVNDRNIKWEIEVKNGDNFDKVVKGIYSDVIINYRKNQNQSHFYCIFSDKFDKLLLTSFKNIKNSKVGIINTDRGRESVFRVDRKYWKLYYIDKNYNIKLIKKLGE